MTTAAWRPGRSARHVAAPAMVATTSPIILALDGLAAALKFCWRAAVGVAFGLALSALKDKLDLASLKMKVRSVLRPGEVAREKAAVEEARLAEEEARTAAKAAAKAAEEARAAEEAAVTEEARKKLEAEQALKRAAAEAEEAARAAEQKATAERIAAEQDRFRAKREAELMVKEKEAKEAAAKRKAEAAKMEAAAKEAAKAAKAAAVALESVGTANAELESQLRSLVDTMTATNGGGSGDDGLHGGAHFVSVPRDDEALVAAVSKLQSQFEAWAPRVDADVVAHAGLLGYWKLLITNSRDAAKVGATGLGAQRDAGVVASYQCFSKHAAGSVMPSLQTVELIREPGLEDGSPAIRSIAALKGDFSVHAWQVSEANGWLEVNNVKQFDAKVSPRGWVCTYLSPALRVSRMEEDGSLWVYTKQDANESSAEVALFLAGEDETGGATD